MRLSCSFSRFLLCALCLLCASAASSVSHANDLGQPIDEKAKPFDKKKADLLFRLGVKKAIGKGARWIAECQQHDGSFKLDQNKVDGPFSTISKHRFGISVLCTYTLADCGYAADHPVVKKALGYIRKRYRHYMQADTDYWTHASAYSLSILVLALHTLYVKPGDRQRLDERDKYGHRKAQKKNPCGYPFWIRKTIDRILKWLIESQSKDGLFRYPGDFGKGRGPPPGMAGPGGPPPSHFRDEDLSNTQYVLLALWAGSRCGLDIKPEVLEKIARRLLAWQSKTGPKVERVEDPQPDAKRPRGDHEYAQPKKRVYQRMDEARGFPYTPGAPVTGSMTTAGLSSLVIVKAMLMERGALKKDLRTELDKGIWDGIAWCQHNYQIDGNPGMGLMWHYYYLYGLERAFVIMQKRFIGEHDWYREGAELLLEAQKKDGRWQPEGSLGSFGAGMGPPGRGPQPSAFRTDVLDTCFALLFLKRATLVPKKPVLDGPTTPRGG